MAGKDYLRPDICFRVKPAMTPLYYYQNPNPQYPLNFGDDLSPMIVSRIIGKQVDVCSRETSPKLLALGSIIHFANNDDILWGTGVNGKIRHKVQKGVHSLDVRAVRGPRSRKVLIRHGIDCPEIYGDPALLLPDLFPEYKAQGGEGVKIICHYHDHQKMLKMGLDFIPAWQSVEDVIAEICRADMVVSSSLHGVIVAEALGIPAVYLRISRREHLLKYKDYYEGTGRKLKFARSVKKALKIGGNGLPNFDAEALIAAFPGELFADRKDNLPGKSPA